MPGHPDAIIIGAGIIGLSVAYYLSRAGLRTVSLERGYLGAGTSGAGNGNVIAGNRQPGPLAEMARRSLAEYERLDGELEGFELARSGSFLLLENEAQTQEARRLIGLQRSRGLSLSLLDARQLVEAIPGVSGDLAGGTWCRDDCSLNPLLLLRALRKAIAQRGGSFVFYQPVVEIRRRGAGPFRVRTPAGVYSSPVLVNCAGALAGEVARLLGERLPVISNQGHIVVTEKTPHLRLPAKLRDWADASDSPPAEGASVNTVIESTASGNLLVGKSEATVRAPAPVSLPVVRAILARAVRFLPPLHRVRVIRIYTGLRPASPDGLPLLGPSPAIAGLYHACGHGGDGVGSAPMSGRLLSGLIAEGRSDPLLGEFAPARFGDRIG